MPVHRHHSRTNNKNTEYPLSLTCVFLQERANTCINTLRKYKVMPYCNRIGMDTTPGWHCRVFCADGTTFCVKPGTRRVRDSTSNKGGSRSAGAGAGASGGAGGGAGASPHADAAATAAQAATPKGDSGKPAWVRIQDLPALCAKLPSCVGPPVAYSGQRAIARGERRKRKRIAESEKAAAAAAATATAATTTSADTTIEDAECAECGHGADAYDRVLVDAECTHDGSIKHISKYHQWGWETFEKRVLCSERLSSVVDLQKRLAR